MSVTEASEMKDSAAPRRPFSLATITLLLCLVLGGLPLAVWLDLRTLAERQLSQQVGEMSTIIDDLRDFYADNVVARAIAHEGPVSASHRYFETEGSIPIPATFSLELVSIFSNDGDSMSYRFVSDYPFSHRTPRVLTDFERRALLTLIDDPSAKPFEISGGLFDRRVKMATPVLMGQSCVDCHNAHPESVKTDWELGDVRGIQAITMRQEIGSNGFAFVYLLAYFCGLTAVAVFVLRRLYGQSQDLQAANRKLAYANDYLASLSMKVSRYISPKVYRRLFSETADDEDIRTDRRKLTIFFSDLHGFTEIAERLQPEELTELLNEYFTEMARLAEAHGGTLDKFVGDAVLVFFGDPVSNGVKEDARACVRMALAMRRRVDELAEEWRNRGVDWPFRMRMGINTGYCNVGNFGSQDRLSYTIIGAEVNLTARLQTHCVPGEIALAQESYFHVRDMVTAHKAEPIHAKGIPHPVSYYIVSDEAVKAESLNVDLSGLQLNLNPVQMAQEDLEAARLSLKTALERLERA